MKKMLLEYANVIGYTVTGLIFGLSFFLLFINFYHAKELSEVVDISSYSATYRENMQTKLNKIKENSATYNQSNYSGKENIFDMNGIQIRINSCVNILESEEAQTYLNKDKVGILDAYHFNYYYQNKILNDCVVMQLNALAVDDSPITVSSLAPIKPFLKLDIDHLLTTPAYIGNNLKNADAYFFSNDINKSSIFHITRDSYYATMNNYQQVLDLLLEVSEWYKDVVVGG